MVEHTHKNSHNVTHETGHTTAHHSAHPAAHKTHKKAAKKAAKDLKKAHKKERKLEKKTVRHAKRSARHAKVREKIRKIVPRFKEAGFGQIGLANLLTLFRIFCIPVFIVFFVFSLYKLALLTLGIAGFTDLIDGTVARMRKENSALGALLDPIADKGLMLVTFVSLAMNGVVAWWFIYIILMRDFTVLAGFIYVKFKKIPFEYKALWTSKIATMCEIVAGVFAMMYLAFPNISISVYPIIDIVYGSVIVAAVLILIATLQYLKLGIEVLEREGSKIASHG